LPANPIPPLPVETPRKPILDTSLVERAQRGDERARSTVLELIEPVLRSFFIRRIGLKAEVDDLTQNTLVRIHLGLVDLKDPSRLKAFAMKAAVYELQDLFRGRYRPKEQVTDLEILIEQHGSEDSGGLEVDVEKALGTLTPRARRIVELREFGYRYEEIAEMIGTTEAAVKMQVKRAFEKLRDVLGGFVLLTLVWRST
jgi:RNA polymerase sigma-70 factor, ECF subfamily